MAKIIPYHAAIERVDLGPRFPRRDPRNLSRVKAVVDESSTHKKSHLRKSVNPYREIKELKRIIEIKQQDIDLLIEMFEGVVS